MRRKSKGSPHGARFAFVAYETLVYRPFVFSIVLTLATVPTAEVWCAGWCAPEGTLPVACSHDAPAPPTTISGADLCGTQAAAITVVTVDTRRPIAAPSFVEALAAGYAAHAPTDGDRAALQTRSSPFHGAHPLIARRI